PGVPEVANLAGLFRLYRGLEAAALGENLLGVVHPDDFVKLHQVDAIGLQALEAFLDLLRRPGLAVAVDFAHQEDLVAIAVAQRHPHPALALTVMVIPAVVHEGDAAIDRSTHDANRITGILGHRHVIAAQTHNRNLLAGMT